MQIRGIAQPVRVFTSKEHGQRLLFVNGLTNPRNQLGKMGVTFHESVFVNKRKALRASFPLLNAENKATDTVFYLNRDSLTEYLKAHSPEHTVDENLTNDGLLDLLEETLEAHQQAILQPPQHDDDSHFEEPTHQLDFAGKFNTRLLTNKGANCVDDARAMFLSWLYQSTILSVSKLHTRFLFARTEGAYFRVGEILSKYRYKQALETVPAYQAFIAQHAPQSFATNLEARFVDIPVTTKKNYIVVNQDADWDLHVNGEYPHQNKTDTSTGTTGKPTSWVRGVEELRTVKRSLRVAAKIEYGEERKLQYINAFALGPWATGITANELMRDTGSLFAAGPDMEKILDQLENRYRYEQSRITKLIDQFIATDAAVLEPQRQILIEITHQLVHQKLDNKDFDLSKGLQAVVTQHPELAAHRRPLLKMIEAANNAIAQNIIAGYPPFLDALTDYAKEKGIDFSKYRTRGIVGGQAISEALREKLIASGFTHINSSYGASDCDINIGVETEFELRFRKVLEENQALAQELYGRNKGVPMVFHYDPFNYKIEIDAEGHLILTCTRSDRSSPRIRYDLGDQGAVYAASDLEALLVKYGYHDLKPRINFPLVFVWGRDSAVTYRGAKVSFTDLERAITNIDKENICYKRSFYAFHDEKGAEQFEIWIELKAGVELSSVQDRGENFLAEMLTNMAKLNQDFKYHLDLKDDVRLPTLRVFTHGKSPISEPGGHRKQVLVFTDANLPKDYKHPNAETEMMVVVINKAFLHGVPVVSYGSGSSRMYTQAPPVEGKGKEEVERLSMGKQ